MVRPHKAASRTPPSHPFWGQVQKKVYLWKSSTKYFLLAANVSWSDLITSGKCYRFHVMQNVGLSLLPLASFKLRLYRYRARGVDMMFFYISVASRHTKREAIDLYIFVPIVKMRLEVVILGCASILLRMTCGLVAGILCFAMLTWHTKCCWRSHVSSQPKSSCAQTVANLLTRQQTITGISCSINRA